MGESANGTTQQDQIRTILDRNPDLAELVDVWVLLDEPIRVAIMAMVRATRKG